MRILILISLTSGCAVIHRPVGEEPPVVTYVGTAEGAAVIVKAQDTKPYDLAQTAMDKGVPVSLTRTDGLVQFSSGNSYMSGPGLYGYAPADVVSTQSGWYTGTGQGSSLPRLGTTVVANASQGSDIVPCPQDRKRATPTEQAACAELDASIALRIIKEKQ